MKAELLAEGNRSRTYQTRLAHLTGFEIRAPHRGRCPSVSGKLPQRVARRAVYQDCA